MREYSFYDKDTGLLHGAVFITDDETHLAVNTPPNHVAIEGKHDHLSVRVDLEKAKAQYEAHLAAHDEDVRPRREIAQIVGLEFQRSVPAFRTTADVLVDYQPPPPSPDHEWNEMTKRWRLNTAVAESRAKRTAAIARIVELENAQHRPLRELVRDPSNGEARTRLDAIDAEIEDLRKVTI